MCVFDVTCWKHITTVNVNKVGNMKYAWSVPTQCTRGRNANQQLRSALSARKIEELS